MFRACPISHFVRFDDHVCCSKWQADKRSVACVSPGPTIDRDTDDAVETLLSAGLLITRNNEMMTTRRIIEMLVPLLASVAVVMLLMMLMMVLNIELSNC